MAEQQNDNQGRLWGIIFLVVLVTLALHLVFQSMADNAPVEVLGSSDGYQKTANIMLIIFQVSSVVAAAMSILYLLFHIQELQAFNEAMVESLRRVQTSQTQNEAILTNINENLLLSDAIKSIAFRQKDRSVLEQAIREDLNMEHWDSAAWLIDELERRFGGKQEAQKLREEMTRSQNSTLMEKQQTAIKELESLWMIHHYREAQQWEEDLLKRYPNNETIKAVQGETERKRLKHKKELLEQLDKASQENDLDRGVEILKLLDNYLTPTEAAALEESARDVFRARLHNMGVQFSLYVTEKTWDKALQIGKQIIKEYPNSRMAQEVREKIHALESRAH